MTTSSRPDEEDEEARGREGRPLSTSPKISSPVPPPVTLGESRCPERPAYPSLRSPNAGQTPPACRKLSSV